MSNDIRQGRPGELPSQLHAPALGVSRTRPQVVNIDALSAEAASVLLNPYLSWSRWLDAADNSARAALKVQVIKNPGLPYFAFGLMGGTSAFVSTCVVRCFGGFKMEDANKGSYLLPHEVSPTNFHPYVSANASGLQIVDTATRGVEWVGLHRPSDNAHLVTIHTSALGQEVAGLSGMSAPVRRLASNGARVRTDGCDLIALHVVDPITGPASALVWGFFSSTP